MYLFGDWSANDALSSASVLMFFSHALTLSSSAVFPATCHFSAASSKSRFSSVTLLSLGYGASRNASADAFESNWSKTFVIRSNGLAPSSSFLGGKTAASFFIPSSPDARSLAFRAPSHQPFHHQ